MLYMHVHVNTYTDIKTVPAACTHIHMPPQEPRKAAARLPACLPACVCCVLTSLCASSCSTQTAAAASCTI